jgi:hypothetical protein
MFCAYCYSPEHVTEDCPEILKKWEVKNTNCNMVHIETCKIKKKNEEAGVQVVTHRGAKKGEKFGMLKAQVKNRTKGS